MLPMQTIRTILIALFCSSLFVQCGSKDDSSFEVIVNYKNADKIPGRNAGTPARIMLEEIPYGGDSRPVLLDSSTLKGNNGKVILKGNGKEEGIYELLVEDGPVILLVNDESDITINVDLSKKDNYYTVSGSPASKELKEFIENYSDKSIPVNIAFKELDSLKQIGASDSIILATTARKNSAIKSLNTYVGTFIDQSDNPAVSLFALGMSSRSFQRTDFENMLNKVVQKFPEHKTLAGLKANYDRQSQESAQQEQKKQEEGSLIGKPAPELSLPSVNGNNISISSFKGKYVLVDFWASWCGPCREENPNVVKAYQQYKDKNFTVLGVSLDKSKDAWIKAIKEDKLDWPHISDLQYWNSKAVEVYKFQGIPYNVLIDPNGIIIAESLRGFDLEKKLAEVLK